MDVEGTSARGAVDDRTVDDRIDVAIRRAHEGVVALQRADGSWQGVNDGGSFSTAWTLAFERYIGVLTERDRAEGVRYLRNQQLPDGSVPGWPGDARGELDGTAQWYAGMLAGGVPESDSGMVRARHWIDERGGFGATL